jgi:hypothetical protein
MKHLQFILAGTVCAAFGIANAAGTLKTYNAETAFVADEAINWSVTGAADASRTLSGTGSSGMVTANAATQSGALERVAASLFRVAGNAGPVTVTIKSPPVMGVGVKFEGGAGRITALDGNGNTLATATSDAAAFAGIRSSAAEIAAVVIESPAAFAVSVATRQVIASDAFFVNQLFQDLYGRMPGASELAEKVEALRTGTATRAEIAAGMLIAGEFHDAGGYLAKCFLALMQRDADFTRWSKINAVMRQGVSRDAALSAFLSTPEFAAAYPASLSDAAFLAKVSQDMIGRQPSSTEFEMWTNQLAHGNSRAEIIDTFLQSPQLETRLAGRINISLSYLALLRRESDPQTLDHWTRALDGSASLTDVVNSVLSSPEYASRF